ncbi:sigma 54-interacting transcriptional regulator [Azoarcus sp. L1K30]|uniref:sigma-54-dependent Fis family transcriptional regulator n=1 Tax=Azoarcus sp. L1K30 TaxID=2820277 RepID=UPI001B813CB4|nr:sigma-54-dependent Fis family transcriptional regulator [Azoarcus sp. L1K30]MBR0565622.1 sigma 54-interacting transcriptional regulator [Azoarcus sp. L1K30]
MADQKLIEQFNLRSRLRFNIDAGQIWLDENRMLLLHAKAMGHMRRELFDALGDQGARGVLIRMGFGAGQQDAELARSLIGEGDPYDVFNIGPELHAFEGMVKPTITKKEIDWEKGIFFGEVMLENTWEAESHIQHFGIGDDPVCWTIVGYASGYTSQFFKRFIVFREVSCVGRGDHACKLIGKPAEAWEQGDGYLDYFRQTPGAYAMRRLEDELAQLRGHVRGPVSKEGKLVGSSPGFRAAFDLVRKAAGSPINVLLLGETGVGKEMFARWLHDHSERASGPFTAINCGAIPHDLIESELFGVEKGAFTGAQHSRPGRFERAAGGTLFLDEVGDLPLAAQVKLLRVLQTGEVERLGDHQTRKIDVRLVAATNVDLPKAIAEGRFRADLYYRLATYPVTIPPLRERPGDIPQLAAALIAKYEKTYGKQLAGLTDRALRALLANRWQGNVRELENLIERGVLLAPEGGLIEVEHLFADPPPEPDRGAEVGPRGVVGSQEESSRMRLCEQVLDRENFNLESHEQRLIELAVARANGNLTHAARTLGITRRQLSYRLKRGETAPES